MNRVFTRAVSYVRDIKTQYFVTPIFVTQKQFKEYKMATDKALQNLEQAVADEQAVDAQVLAALTNLQGQITDLQNQLAGQANLDPAIQAQADAIEAEVAKLAAAIAPAPAPQS